MQPPNQPTLNSEGMPRPPGVQEQVSLPAILLLVLGALSGAFVLFNTFAGGWIASLLAGYPGLPPEIKDALRDAKHQPLNPLQLGCGFAELAADGVAVFGALQMRNLKMWGLAVAASIIVMIPCFSSLCCIPGLGVGIWSLVVLNKPEVKSAFS